MDRSPCRCRDCLVHYESQGVSSPFSPKGCQCYECKRQRGISGRSAIELCDDIKDGRVKYSAFNAMPRKPGPAGPTLDWRKITDVFKEPKEFPTVAVPLRFAPDDIDIRSNEALRRNTQRDSYEQTLHAQGLTSVRCTCSDCCCWRVTQGRTGDDVSLCHCKECEGGYLFAECMKAYGRSPAELGMTERDLEDTKHTNDVLRLLKAGVISPNEARYHLGLPEPLQVIKEPIPPLNPDDWDIVTPGYQAKPEKSDAFRGASPDMLFVSPKDAEWIMKLYEPTSNTKENPMPISTSSNPVRDLADRARELAQDGKVNLDSVKCAIDQGKQERKERIEKALSGAVELDVLKGPQGKQFVLKHFHRDEVYTVYGVAYPGYDASEKEAEQLEVETMKLQACNDPLVYNSYETMRELRTHLDNQGVPHVLKFYE